VFVAIKKHEVKTCHCPTASLFQQLETLVRHIKRINKEKTKKRDDKITNKTTLKAEAYQSCITPVLIPQQPTFATVATEIATLE